MSSTIVSFGETMLRLTVPSDHRLEITPQLQVYISGGPVFPLAKKEEAYYRNRTETVLTSAS